MPAPAPETVILTRRDVAALMTPSEYLRAAEVAFRGLASGAVAAPLPMHVDGRGGVFHAKGASLDAERPVVAIKLNGNFPANRARFGLPTIQGAILLADAENGALLAIMDSIEITLRRTAAASALAAKHLARPQSSRLAICGCGDQGRVQLEALASIFAARSVTAWDADISRAREYATLMSNNLSLAIEPRASLEEATTDADIIVTCTTAQTPFLTPAFVRPGAFVAAVGADSPQKSEIAPALMARAKVVADVLGQCVQMGDLHHAIAAGAMTQSDVYAELGDIVSGSKPGRANDDDVFIFDSTGTAAQDVAAAVEVYGRAVATDCGLRLALGS